MIAEWMWIAWLATTAGAFAVLETIALVNRRKGDTLSERTRAWLGITPPNARRRIAVPVFAAVLILFVCWFLPHIVFDVL